MPKLRKVDGVWREVADRYRKINGQWRKVVESYRKVDGIWQKVFGNEYLQYYVINPDPDLSDAGVYYDAATNSYRAYINGRPSHSNGVEVGIRIGNLPMSARVSVRLATYGGIPEPVPVVFYSNVVNTEAPALGVQQITSAPVYATFDYISNAFFVVLRLAGTNQSTSKVNFELSDIKINDVSRPLP